MIVWDDPGVSWVLLAGIVALVSAAARIALGRRGQSAPGAALGAYLLLLAAALAGLAIDCVTAFKAVASAAEADKEAMLSAGMALALGPARLAALFAAALVVLDGLGSLLTTSNQAPAQRPDKANSPNATKKTTTKPFGPYLEWGNRVLVPKLGGPLLGGLALYGLAELLGGGATFLQVVAEGAFDEAAAGEVLSTLYRATLHGVLVAVCSLLVVAGSLGRAVLAARRSSS